MFVMFPLFAVHSPLCVHVPLVSGLSVLLLLGFFYKKKIYIHIYFSRSLSVEPHLPLIFSYSLFDISFRVVVSLSLTLLLLPPCLCLFDALIVG